MAAITSIAPIVVPLGQLRTRLPKPSQRGTRAQVTHDRHPRPDPPQPCGVRVHRRDCPGRVGGLALGVGGSVMQPVIYHGTPLTPRAALLEVCTGRAMCVSFFRPDDVEAVEAISPDIMFRQRGLFHVESGATSRRGLGRALGLVGLLRMAGAALVSTGAVGSHPRYAGCAVTAQRCAARSMAVRTQQGRAPLAHGRANRAALAALRQVRPGVSRMDRRGQASRPARVSRADGGSRSGFGQPLACSAHDARDQGRLRLPLRQRGRDNTGTEWMAI